MKIFTIIFKIFCLIFIIPSILEVYEILCTIQFSDKIQLAFGISFLTTALISSVTIKAHSYFAILVHELTHNLWAVITFNKPVAINVKAQRGGQFQFAGKQNILTLLSPYFFPIFSFFWIIIYGLISYQAQLIYFIILGISYGITFSIGVRQANYNQPDFRPFGVFWSYTFIFFFQIIIFSVILSFVIYKQYGFLIYLKGLYQQFVILTSQIKLHLPNVNF